MFTAETKQKLPTAMLFDEISNFWEEIAEANSTEKQTNFVMKNIEKDGLFLDLCCGSGRHSIQLCKREYEIIGLDISSRLLRMAKLKAAEANVKLQLVRADMRFVPFKSEVFNAVVSLDASFGYLSSNVEDAHSLNEVSRTLRHKGLFLIDLFNPHRLKQRYTKRFTLSSRINIISSLLRFPGLFRLFRWKEYPSFFLLQLRQVTTGGDLVETWFFRDRKTKQISSYLHIVRLYNFPQFRTMLEKACLQTLKTYGHYDGQEYNNNSARLIVVAQKV